MIEFEEGVVNSRLFAEELPSLSLSIFMDKTTCFILRTILARFRNIIIPAMIHALIIKITTIKIT